MESLSELTWVFRSVISEFLRVIDSLREEICCVLVVNESSREEIVLSLWAMESLSELTWVFRSVISEFLDIKFSLIETIKESFSVIESVSNLFFSSSSLIRFCASTSPGLLDSSVGSVPIATSVPSSKPSLSVSFEKSLVPMDISWSWFRPSPSLSSDRSSMIAIRIEASSDSPLDSEPLKFKVIVDCVS